MDKLQKFMRLMSLYGQADVASINAKKLGDVAQARALKRQAKRLKTQARAALQ